MRKTFVFLAVLTLLSASSVDAQKRRAVSHPSPLVEWKAAMSTQLLDNGMHRAIGHIFTYLPVGATVERQVIQPDGTVYHYADGDISTIGVPGSPWIVSMWWDFFPPGWPAGVTTFKTVVTIYGKQYSVKAEMPYKVINQQLDPPSRAVVDASGGIMFLGYFSTPIVAVSPNWMNEQIQLVGGNYVPPGAIGTGKKVITWSTGINGDPNHLISYSQVVDLDLKIPSM